MKFAAPHPFTGAVARSARKASGDRSRTSDTQDVIAAYQRRASKMMIFVSYICYSILIKSVFGDDKNEFSGKTDY